MSEISRRTKHYPGCDAELIILDELLPCPFCGSAPELEITPGLDDEKDYQVKCRYCFAETHYESSQEAAVNAWNRRAEI